MKSIMIEVNAREMDVLTRYAVILASTRLNEGSIWDLLDEAANVVTFQVHDDEEARELHQRGVKVDRGMAFLDPKNAVQMMNSMAQSREMFKDVPTITSLVRKIASRLGQRPPQVVPGAEASGQVGDITAADPRATQHPGAEQARYAGTETAPELMSPEEHEALYGRVGYEPTKASIPPPGEAPPLASTPMPGTRDVFQPVSPSSKERVKAQDVAQMRGSTSAQRDITGRLIDPKASAQAPEEDPTKWDLEEAYHLLGIRSWRNRNV